MHTVGKISDCQPGGPRCNPRQFLQNCYNYINILHVLKELQLKTDSSASKLTQNARFLSCKNTSLHNF